MSNEIVRKILPHGTFGPCVLLPKTEWSRLPSRGPARILLKGVPTEATICVEECNCRGTGHHEHRFLALAGGVAAGETVRIGLE